MDPEVLSNSRAHYGCRSRAWFAGQAGEKVSPVQEINGPSRRSPANDRWRRRRNARAGRGRAAAVARRTAKRLWSELLDMTIGGEDAQPIARHHGNPGRHRRRRSRPLRPRSVRNVPSPRRVKGWKTEILGTAPRNSAASRISSWASKGRASIASCSTKAAATACSACPIPKPRPHPHFGRDGRRVARAGRSRSRHQAGRLSPDTFCASGPGGQHVNKTASAVRLTHYETGIVVQCQDEKSQLKNKNKALRELAARIYDAKTKAGASQTGGERKSLVGSGDRSERIRTYNFPQNRLPIIALVLRCTISTR